MQGKEASIREKDQVALVEVGESLSHLTRSGRIPEVGKGRSLGRHRAGPVGFAPGECVSAPGGVEALIATKRSLLIGGRTPAGGSRHCRRMPRPVAVSDPSANGVERRFAA
jgi:hypothetical protein